MQLRSILLAVFIVADGSVSGTSGERDTDDRDTAESDGGDDTDGSDDDADVSKVI